MKCEYKIGDCIELMKLLEPNSIDACVTDPPYGLEFMGNQWDRFTSSGRGWRTRVKEVSDDPEKDWGVFNRVRGPDGYVAGPAFYEFSATWGVELLRILKPGAHALVFGGTRTYHRMVCALEDIGFQVRDGMMWLYGSGFPKSYDVSKGIDKQLGLEDQRPVVAPRIGVTKTYDVGATETLKMRDPVTGPASEKAKEWQGWGTGLKPAWEPIAVLRKPLIGTVVENVLTHSTGAINIDACRVPFINEADREEAKSLGDSFEGHTSDTGIYGINVDHSFARSPYVPEDLGRWPANLLLDEEAAVMLDQQSGESESKPGLRERTPNKVYNAMSGVGRLNVMSYDDFGGASRFFYTAKASRSERDQGLDGVQPQVSPWQHDCGMFQNDPSRQPVKNFHPTVKPLALIRYLVRLVTPKEGTCIDPFLGSGTTLVACRLEGRAGLGFEKEAMYEPLIRKRLSYVPPALETFIPDDGLVATQIETLIGSPPKVAKPSLSLDDFQE